MVERGTTTKKARAAAAQQDADRARADMKMELWTKVIDGAKWVLIVVGSWVPLQVVEEMVDHLAGETTVVNANMVMSASVTYSAVATVGWGVTAYRGARRKKSIEAARRRMDTMESKLLGTGGT